MDKLTIRGGHQLNGKIRISGAKNSALKLMAAALLTDEPVELRNMPNLADSRFMARLLSTLGVDVYWPQGDSTCRLNAANISSTIAPYDLVRKMRATFNVLGPLLGRIGHATVSLPGGCAIGARPVNFHLDAFEAMGADIVIEQGYVKAAAIRGLNGAIIDLPFPSVGATEHTMMAATLAKGTTTINNAAREPEIIDIANMLKAMGAKIEGEGTSTIRIEGVDKLKGVSYSVMPDRIEAGTYAMAAAAAGGDVLLEGAPAAEMTSLLEHLRKAGVTATVEDNGVRIQRNGARLKAVDVDVQPHPGFATDLQAQFMALMTVADGTSTITENIFENRFLHAPELNRFGADIRVQGKVATVHGVDHLVGAPVMATDLRASVSLVIAGLVAEGETEVNRIYHLDRGFENLEEKLNACGARIERGADTE
ncbi:UDP-N-acetylglucosamine 1-carboxyvinyltransferase [Ponticaulis koreensis]|uniref:UDP-N-acetylglucosamine 1-carboxyvinyltransferase n=1 Tax=Ponticaulis koreensis TaxID=1123045 RepID=UPI0003B4D08A|nr:UDP-N-acetylglucosamine 1-carboxyvinyltransferase [Ponticaulis koreensis]